MNTSQCTPGHGSPSRFSTHMQQSVIKVECGRPVGLLAQPKQRQGRTEQSRRSRNMACGVRLCTTYQKNLSRWYYVVSRHRWHRSQMAVSSEASATTSSSKEQGQSSLLSGRMTRMRGTSFSGAAEGTSSPVGAAQGRPAQPSAL